MATGARSYVPFDGTLGHGIAILGGYFECTSSTTAPSVGEGLTGRGWTVAHTSTGLYTLTFDQGYQAFAGTGLAFHTTSTSTDFTIEWGAADVVTAKTMVIKLKTGGTLTDPTPGTGIGISFMVMMRRSKVTT